MSDNHTISKNESIFIKCDCTTHLLEAQYDKEGDSLDLTFWVYPDTNRPLSFCQRLKWCWRILTTGHPWADYLVVNKDKIVELRDYLTKITK